MSIVLYHHPFSRAANVVWMLEEVGVPYELRYVDFMAGQQKSEEILALNPMGKLPTAYSERLAARPALERAEARNAAVREANGLNRR